MATTSDETAVTVRRVEDGDVYMRVSSIGSEGERAFVLVPGIGVSSNYFERLAPNLNEFGPVHAVDLPGFAGVPHPGRALTMSEYADLLGKTIDELGIVDPVIVGHSMGTQVVADLASRRSDLTTIVLIGPVVNAAERSVRLAGIRFLQSSWHEPWRVKILASSAYLLCGVKWFSRILPEMMRFPIEDRVAGITASTLIIRGEFDAVSPRSWVEHLGALIPTSRLWEIPTAAHSVMHAHAEEVAKLCLDHARQVAESGVTDDDTLRHATLHPDDERREDLNLGLADSLKAAKGRIAETIGMVTGDDELIAEGKTEHARAVANAVDRAVDGADDADGRPDGEKPDPAR